MKPEQMFRIILLLACLSANHVLPGQSPAVYRLIGTRTDYNFYDTDWKSYDSSRYVYTGSAIRHQTPSPLETFNGLQGRVPLTINQYTPYYYAGAFPNVSYPIIVNLDSIQYDSLIGYGFDYPLEDAWSVTSRHTRSYVNHLLLQENHESSAPYLDGYHILYNAAGLPIEYEVSSGYFYPLDPFVIFKFSYSDHGLVSYTKEYPPSGLKVSDVEYTFDTEGRPIEELKRLYQQFVPNLPYLYQKWVFMYDKNGRITNMQRWLPDNGTWVQDWEYQFVMENDLPKALTALYREVDTLSTPTILGDWDIVFRTQLYYTETQVDSVISERPQFSETDLSIFRREYFSYSTSGLSEYSLVYDEPGIYNDDQHISFGYDESGRLTTQYKTTEYSYYCSQYDSYYHYDDADNVVLMEVNKGTSYEEPCGAIILTTQERYYYYYEKVPFAGKSDGDLALHVFPSPATDQFSIQTEGLGNSSDDLLIRIFNMQGQEVFTTVRSGATTYITINCNSWGSGVYVVKAEQGVSAAWQKVIIH